MAALRKATEVDGLSLVRAVRHARAGDHEPRPPASPPPERTEPPHDASGERAARIGRTAMPTRNEIHCYECGYAFQSTGRMQSLLCPKCRRALDQADYTIEGESATSVRTTGNIRLAAGGVLKSGTLVARDISLAGAVEGGSVKAHRRLTIEPGATFDPDVLSCRDLTVLSGARMKFAGKRNFRSVEVSGELEGHLAVDGPIYVRAGGHLKGRLEGAHLIVEDGGGLTADVEIMPPSRA
jgi:cytoskeletal protein CcmA (bactofilin family)